MINTVINWDDQNAYFFVSNLYYKYDMHSNTEGVVAGYPRPISGNWGDLPFASVDAGVRWNNGKVYFFRNDQYVGFMDGNIDASPRPIKDNWAGIKFSKIDAAVLINDDQAWFFSGNQCLEFDVRNDKAKGIAKPISAVFRNLPAVFQKGIDAAVLWNNNKMYFFKGDEYVRLDPNTRLVDANFITPISISKEWKGMNLTSLRTTSVDMVKMFINFRCDFGLVNHNEMINRVKDISGNIISVDYTGGGTTCGFLCHWFLWRIGLEDYSILNRSILKEEFPVDSYKNKVLNKSHFKDIYIDGVNISKLTTECSAYKNVQLNNAFLKNAKPQLGDIIHIKKPNTNDDHVFIMVKELSDSDGVLHWATAEAGQKDSNIPDVLLKTRRIQKNNGLVVLGNGKKVVGWLSLDKLKLHEPKSSNLHWYI
jgi:hypothetical protein